MIYMGVPKKCGKQEDFTPTPMTLATAMYYLGFDPYTGKKVYVARDIEEKRRQKGYFFRGKRK